MPAFQFPDPTVEQTVINTLTGSTYQWIEDPGKWVVTAKLREVSDIIWEGDDEPDPNPGNYKLWYHTDKLELYFWYEDENDNGAWVPTSAPITMIEDLDRQVFDLNVLLQQVNVATSENESEIQRLKDDLDLEQVLTNGNIADKGILLTDASDALIALNPDEALITIASDTEKENPRISFTHVDDQLHPNAQFQIELDNDGTRADFEFLEDITSAHFNFEGEDKFVLNKTGDAEFTGKVKVEPGLEGNEAVTYQQLEELEGEIETIIPSLERGRWEFSTESSSAGLYNIIRIVTAEYCEEQYAQCLIDADSDPGLLSDCNRQKSECDGTVGDLSIIDEWDGTKVFLARADLDGVVHLWENLEQGEELEISNEDGSGFAIYEVTGSTVTGSGRVEIPVALQRSFGVPSGPAKVKVYRITDASAADFVRKAGDTMTGKLTIKPELNTQTGLVVYNGAGLEDTASVTTAAFVNSRGKPIMQIYNTGLVALGDRSFEYTPTSTRAVVTKGYVDEKFAASTVPGSPYVFTNKNKEDLAPGEMMKEGKAVHVSIMDKNGVSHYPDNDTTTWTGPWYVLKVYDSTGQKVIIHTGVKVYGKGRDGYLAWAVTSSLRDNDLTVGSTYYVADGLFLSY